MFLQNLTNLLILYHFFIFFIFFFHHYRFIYSCRTLIFWFLQKKNYYSSSFINTFFLFFQPKKKIFVFCLVDWATFHQILSQLCVCVFFMVEWKEFFSLSLIFLFKTTNYKYIQSHDKKKAKESKSNSMTESMIGENETEKFLK